MYFSPLLIRLGIVLWLVTLENGVAQVVYTPRNPPVTAFNGLQTIQNDRIKVGVDSRYGGAITYLSVVNGPNMVNNFDLGRQIQIGLYSNPNPYSENGIQPRQDWVGLGWNPIQAGDIYGNPSNVLDFQKTDELLYVKTHPRHFPLNNVLGESYIEHWIKLVGNVVKVHAKATLFRSDKTPYEGRQQEMPCIYLNGHYHNIYAYTGNNPFANDALTKIRPPVSFGDIFPTEPWMASIDDNGFGVGLYSEDSYDWKKGYFGSDLAGDEFTQDASYIANTPFIILDHNITYEWDYEMVVGSLPDIRAYMYAKPRPASGPNYRFDTSRRGWHYFNAVDTGWPIQGYLDIKLTNKQRDLIQSPGVCWKGSNNTKLYLRAAFQTQHNSFRLSWKNPGQSHITRGSDQYLDFPINNDGQFHTYEIDLSKKQNWQESTISQIEFRPPPDGPDVSGWVKLGWLATSADGPKNSPVSGNVPVVTTPVALAPASPTACPPKCVPFVVQKRGK
ncbi:hypothetical protein M0L20_02790 [Spirosoma sp. RP8]|uniref:DUF946 domain-containing protein n=1 Tax=Spirosoma liriopis TaxID=2937440 RepID=A0ABT0HF27_9BACT|nr:hypothetical protein [Spirosoma liriopis]MCK8490761.1 hypothetical protein [Spirosoma liriopis]